VTLFCRVSIFDFAQDDRKERDAPIKLRLLILDFVMQRGVLEAPEEPPDVSREPPEEPPDPSTSLRMTASGEDDRKRGGPD
jgi:hypothetical protein